MDPALDAAAASLSDEAPRPVSYLFRKAQVVYNEVENTSLSGSDAGLQAKIVEGLALTDTALRQVVSLSIFSKNETIEDINTGDIRYLLLPMYRAELLLKRNEPTPSKRIPLLRDALAGLRGFLCDLQRLEALTSEARTGWESAVTPAADAGAARTLKIARLRASRAAKQALQVLGEKLSAKARGGDDDDDDDDADEMERDHVLLMLACASHAALDSERAATQELDMLEQIEKMRRPDGSLPAPPKEEESAEAASRRFRTLTLLPQDGLPQSASRAARHVTRTTPCVASLLTRHGWCRQANPQLDPANRLSYETAMRQIHTGQIPGLYTYSVEEGLRHEEAQRAMAEAQRMQEMGERALARDEAREEAEGGGEEDAGELAKKRTQDDWRDTHKRGDGNRKNRN